MESSEYLRSFCVLCTTIFDLLLCSLGKFQAYTCAQASTLPFISDFREAEEGIGAESPRAFWRDCLEGCTQGSRKLHAKFDEKD